MHTAIRIFIGALLMVAIVSTQVAASWQAAKIKGLVNGIQADGSKLPLAGAVVTLRGTALTTKDPVTVTTDEEGRYTLFDLLPGDYQLTIEVPGFESYSKSYKIVSGAVSAITVDLRIKETKEAVVEIKANPNEIDKTQTSVVSQIQEKTLRNAPLVNETFQDALPLVPGVVRGPDGLLNIKGARASQSGLLVNSANVTDPATGNYAISLPIEAIETVSVLSSPYSAEFGKFSGAVTTIGTRAGGNTWRFLFTNFIPRMRRRTDPDTGKSKLVGLESITPRLIFMGPIIKDKLTISQSFQYQFVRNIVPSLPNLKNDVQYESFDSFTQLDWNINERNHLTGVLSLYPQNLQSVNLNTFNPIEVSANFRQRGFFASAAERAVFTNGSLLETTFAAKRFNAFVFPQGDTPMTVAPAVNSGNFFNRQDRYSTRYDGQSIYSFAPVEAKGNHLLKVGTTLSYTTFDGRDRNSRIDVVRQDGTLSQRIEFVGDGQFERNVGEVSLFFQDKYTVRPNVVLDLGLRYDRNGLSNQNNFAPRFGFVMVPFSGGRTVIRGGIGVFYDKVPLGIGVFDRFQSRRVTAFQSDGITPTGPAETLLNVFAGELRTPYSVSGTFEVDHQLFKRFFVRFGYQKREGKNEFLVNPEVDPRRGPLLVMSNGATSSYREYQITSRYRFNDVSDISFSYVRSKTTGDLNDFNTYFGNFRAPIIRDNQRSRQPFDTPNRFLTVGNFELPFGVVASPVLDIHTGFPFSRVDNDQNFVGIRNPDDQRFLRFLALDLQVTKKIAIPFRGKKLITRIGVKIFNLTNHFNPRDVQANIGSPMFGEFYNSIGRTFRGKFEFDF